MFAFCFVKKILAFSSLLCSGVCSASIMARSVVNGMLADRVPKILVLLVLLTSAPKF
jgi:hypothetical protein